MQTNNLGGGSASGSRLSPIHAADKLDRYGYRSKGELIEIAAERSARLVTPGERELLIDLDSSEDLDEFMELLDLLQEWTGELKITVSPSRTAGHYHAHVEFPPHSAPLTPIERVAWELALGSDRVRGLLALIRLEMKLGEDQAGDGLESILFETNQPLEVVPEGGLIPPAPQFLRMRPGGGLEVQQNEYYDSPRYV